jgi:hypothetical protein
MLAGYGETRCHTPMIINTEAIIEIISTNIGFFFAFGISRSNPGKGNAA